MSAKTMYTDEVSMMRLLSETDHELARAFKAGKYRKQTYGHNWQSVDLEEFVKKHVPDCVKPELVINRTPRSDGSVWVTIKFYYFNKDRSKAVVADFGGGYCRLVKIDSRGKETYLDINGNDCATEILPNGHRRSRTKSEREEISHFNIKKKEN